MALLLFPFGLLTLLLFSLDIIFPIWASMLLSCVAVIGYCIREPPLNGILFKYFLILFALPFIHGFEYIGFDFTRNEHPVLMWGLLTNPYTFQEPILRRTFMLALVGLLAMLSGSLFIQTSMRGEPQEARPSLSLYRSLPFSKFLGMLSSAFLLSWMNTPKDSILNHSYGTAGGGASSFNFNASWMVSYIILVALFIDQEFIGNSPRKRLCKRICLFGVTLYIVIFHQFMRGDRECITLIAAFIALFVAKSLHSTESSLLNRRYVIRKVIIIGFLTGLLFFAANLVGSLRSTLAQNPSSQEIQDSIRTSLAHFYAGTWSAVLLTPLSIVGDFFLGIMDFRLGSTYMDSLLSLIPSPIAQFLDYARPIEGTRGPSWDMRFGIGGTHVLVVPYMNFGIIGVYVMMFLQATAFAWIDETVQYRNNFSKIFFFGSLIVVGPHWYWYGDMSLVRGVMAYGIAWLLYCFLALNINNSPDKSTFLTWEKSR